jgi:hypothetical protein
VKAATRFDTQNVGALPVVTRYLERLQVADTVNALVPWNGEVPWAPSSRPSSATACGAPRPSSPPWLR